MKLMSAEQRFLNFYLIVSKIITSIKYFDFYYIDLLFYKSIVLIVLFCLQLSLMVIVLTAAAMPTNGLPRPQDPEQTEVGEEVAAPSEVPTDAKDPKFEGSQLALALKLSNAGPQEVSASSYAGKRRRSPDESLVQEEEQVNPDHEGNLEEEEDHDARFGGSQLALALKLSGAGPQPVFSTSYAGRRRRSAQEEPTLIAQEAVPVAQEAEQVGDAADSKFEGSQLALALKLSNAGPQAVSASSYAG